MQKLILLILCCVPFFTKAQNDVLILQKKGKHIRSYAVGSELDMETVYGQRFQGMITNIRHDSIFLDGQPWHYKEIAVIHRKRIKSDFLVFGTALMAVSGGILILGAVNGLYRKDPFNEWYTKSGLITAGIALAGGYLLRRSYYVRYPIGKKYALLYVDAGAFNKKDAHSF